MHVALTLLFTIVCFSSSAQLPGLLLTDETGMYQHALDSAINMIERDKLLRTVYVTARECVTDHLPGMIRSSTIITDQKKVKRKNAKLGPDEIILTIACGQIIEDKVAIIIATPEPGPWVFAFWYSYQPGSKENSLLFVAKGRSSR
jgi:hypothetical protein